MIKKIQVILLVDWKLTDKPFWLQQCLNERGFLVKTIGISNYDLKFHVNRWRKIYLWWQYLVLGLKGVRALRKKGGVIVSWNFICGVFAALFNKKRNPPIIGLNMIAHQKGMLNNFLRHVLYKRIFSKRKIIATVNSKELIPEYSKIYYLQPDQLHVLHDPWSRNYPVCKPSKKTDDYIFSGGEAARDWKTMLNVAERTPNIPYKIIARQMNWLTSTPIPDNVQVEFDTSVDVFYERVRNAQIVLLTLKGKITAGLIVLIRSILMGKLVVSTDTPATQIYYPATCHDLLINEGDVEGFRKKIFELRENDNLRVKKSIDLQKYVLSNFSPEKFSDQVKELILKAYQKSL